MEDNIMNKQQVMLTPDVIEHIRMETKQEWRKCKRKQYNIFACKVPAGYIFANKLEQPESYNAIKQTFHKDFVYTSEFNKVPQLVEFLKQHGFYQTDGTRIVLCGTKGELWDVKPEKLVQSYRLMNGMLIRDIKDNEWFEVSRAGEASATSVGIQLPNKYLGVYQASWATLTVNNPNSGGHGKGDILVAPLLPNGQPDYSNISPTNNEVFALTYDQNVGGWANSNLVTNPNRIKPIYIADIKKQYNFGHSVDVFYDSVVKRALKMCSGFIESSETIDEETGARDCWIYDPRIGRTFNVCYDESGYLGLIAEMEEYETVKREQWLSNPIKLSNSTNVDSILNQYNEHVKNIAVRFRKYCEKNNLRSLYSLSQKRRSDGRLYLDKAKMNFLFKIINTIAHKHGWSTLKISDNRIHDDMNEILSGDRKDFALELEFPKGFVIIYCSIESYNAFHFCGWNTENMDRDPYEANFVDQEDFDKCIEIARSNNY